MSHDPTYAPGEALPELLPCPFCGGPVFLEQPLLRPGSRRTGERWGVVCRNLISLGGTCAIEQVPSASKEAAIARWNSRAPIAASAVPDSVAFTILIHDDGRIEGYERMQDMSKAHENQQSTRTVAAGRCLASYVRHLGKLTDDELQAVVRAGYNEASVAQRCLVWVRAQAATEPAGDKREAFIETHNALSAIIRMSK